MRVVVLDPSCFTMPYDHCLCDALGCQGCTVVFVGSRYIHGDWNHSGHYARREHFYRMTHRVHAREWLGPLWLGLKATEHAADMGRLVAWLRDWRPDIIHFQWLPWPMVDRLYLPAVRHIAPIILTVHDTQPFHGRPSSRLQSWGIQNVHGYFDHCIVHTEFTRGNLLGKDVPDSHISVIPMGALDQYAPAPHENPHHGRTGSERTKRRILFFGAIRPNKGLDLLIRALALLPETLRQTELSVCGIPRMPVTDLRRLAESLHVEDRIRWDLRFVPEQEVGAVFGEADVVALPYREIDQSAVLLTALALGKPVVATRVGGFPELLTDGIHGHLVDPDDPEAMAMGLAHILSNPAVAEEMGRAAAALASKLPWKMVAEMTLQVYKKELSRSHGPS